MTKPPSDWRMGLYECRVEGDRVVGKGRAVGKYYYGLYSHELAKSTILPELREAKSAGSDFEFPVLIVSWRLGKGDPPKPLPKPPGPLFVSKVGGLRNLKRIVGIPTQRKKVTQTERWEAVIDEKGRVLEVENGRLKNVSP